jgi:hypothetical protein
MDKVQKKQFRQYNIIIRKLQASTIFFRLVNLNLIHSWTKKCVQYKKRQVVTFESSTLVGWCGGPGDSSDTSISAAWWHYLVRTLFGFLLYHSNSDTSAMAPKLCNSKYTNHRCSSLSTECLCWVINTPAAYSGAPDLKFRSRDRLSDLGFRGLTQSLHSDAVTGHFWPLRLPSRFFPFHHSLFSFIRRYIVIERASLNNLQTTLISVVIETSFIPMHIIFTRCLLIICVFKCVNELYTSQLCIQNIQ